MTSIYKATTVFNCKHIGNGEFAAYVGVLELPEDNFPIYYLPTKA
jgi:hypothetical protein